MAEFAEINVPGGNVIVNLEQVAKVFIRKAPGAVTVTLVGGEDIQTSEVEAKNFLAAVQRHKSKRTEAEIQSQSRG